MTEQGTHSFLEQGVVLNGRWEILGHIATGGKGEVYRARQTKLDREVVVKIISKEYLADLDGDEDYIETELQRFHREALAMAQIRHPYIVQVYDQDEAVVTRAGVEESVHYLVMEYINGPSLRATMPTEGFCTNEQELPVWITEFFLPVLEGIQSIHDLGIVHRDIKPENVLLENNTPKIMDFGIAGGVRWSNLTKSHHVEGTITYMAPEQFMDLAETDVRGDVYALGKILYEAVVGKLDKKTACPLKGVCLPCPDTPFLKRLDLIIQESTADDKELRISSVKVFKERLEKVLEDFDPAKIHFMGISLPRPGTRHIVAAVAVAVCVIGLIVASNLIHHAYMIRHTEKASESLADPSREPGKVEPERLESAEAESASTLHGQDGSVLKLVPGGDFTLPGQFGAEAGESFHKAPFYMGETEVTNSQYVKFLNHVVQRVSVDGDLVEHNGITWLILGEVFGGYEPIVFQDGAFAVKDTRYEAHPVVRVTAYGASEYARYYGDRLPTELEWYAAASSIGMTPGDHEGKGVKSYGERTDLEREISGLIDVYGVLDKVEDVPSGDVSMPSRIPHRVDKFPPNAYGLRGLRANVGEWGLKSPVGAVDKDEVPRYTILGGLEGTWLLGTTLIRGPEQDPHRASASVGFRIVRDAGDRPRREEQKNDVPK
ncbi:MAG: bifunctional serine/threonine-protein kinase/formylglycine-generating enzyme family protein [Desulfomonilaceae bacterium]|nr:bifunctional serine/threonine-protein kinase/formylglycine-generating enzyme family protein [Desulfomonilaceae bacterium]